MSLQAPSLGTTALPAAPERPRHAGDPPASVQDVDDVDLIRRTTRGDGQAFEVLMRRHNQKLYRAEIGRASCRERV